HELSNLVELLFSFSISKTTFHLVDVILIVLHRQDIDLSNLPSPFRENIDVRVYCVVKGQNLLAKLFDVTVVLCGYTLTSKRILEKILFKHAW
ncbi:MAG: hypothetical protein KC535_05815, partial [Nanoarchaeota archaeon]|nr:hypothetical protein [Nanoarchaeota archaeon]